MIQYETLLSLWDQALKSPLGIRVKVASPTGLKHALYDTRKASKNPDYDRLVLVVDGDMLWIVKKEETEGKEVDPKDFERL